ncbi:MAG TPA: hypothetical protein VJT81_13495 [Burkholderiales bacterium]|nr:hypothetical protein [Burkholderiales bacterium]
MTDAIAALIQLAPNLANLAKDLVSASDTAKRNAQLIEFQNALIGLQSLIASIQQENAALIRQKSDAEEELKRMKDWDAEKQRYKMATPYDGVTVYAMQKAMSKGEPAHYLCANCFYGGKRSILANSSNKEGWAAIVCAVCKFAAQTRFRALGPAKYAEDVAPE